MDSVDICIVGAGPVGLAAAIEARRRGASVVNLDKGTIVQSIYDFPSNTVFFSEAHKVEIGGHPLVAQGPKPTRRECLVYYRRVAEVEGLDVRTYAEVREIRGDGSAPFQVIYREGGGERRLAARVVMVATGYFDNPNRLEVPGGDLPHVTYRYRDPLPYWGRQVALVGGSNSAVETALELYRSGVAVTLIHRDRDVSPKVKYWLGPDFRNRVAEGAIATRYEAEVRRIEPDRVVIERRGVLEEVPATAVIVAIGYRAVDHLLRQAGARFDQGRPVLTDAFETTIPRLYAIGSAGFGAETRFVFIENGRLHAARAVEHAVDALRRVTT